MLKVFNQFKIIIVIIIISSFSALLISLNMDKIISEILGYETKLYMDIKHKFTHLGTNEFLEYLSSLGYINLNNTLSYYVGAMRDYNIAIDPASRNAPLQAIKNLNEMKDIYDADLLKNKLNIDINTTITDLEYSLILKNSYRGNNRLFFGRLNNSTPIPFKLLDKIGDDYLILQSNVYDLGLSADEVYKSGECLLKSNNLIAQCFELEKELIKDIFILNEDDYKKYNKLGNIKSVDKYLNVELKDAREDYKGIHKLKSLNCEMNSNDNVHTTYWVRNNSSYETTKICIGNNIVDAIDNEKYAVRLAIIVRGDLYDKN